MNRYYVYLFLREDGTPYYVGKGTGGRQWDWRRPDYAPLPADRARNIRVLDGMSEEDSHAWEKLLIARWGITRYGTGILENRTYGGEGTSGYIHTDETKARLSDGWRDPDEAARRRAANKASWDNEKRAKRSADSSALHAPTVEANAALVGLSVPDYLALSAVRRHELVKRAQGLMRPLLTTEEKSRINSEAKLKAAAKKLAAGLGLTEDEYMAMSVQERSNLSRRIKNGPKPAINPKVRAAAEAYGVDVEWYAGLTAKEKHAFRERVARANKKAADCSAA